MGVSTSQRRSLLTAAIIGGVLSLVILLGTATLLSDSRGDVDKLAYGDGLLYRYAAANLSTPTEELDPIFVTRGTALRFGRIGLPATMWALAGGKEAALPFAQAAIMVASGATAAMACSALFPRAGPPAALIPFLIPGFALAVSGGYAEAPAAAAALLGLWALQRGRIWMCMIGLAFAMLSRENAAASIVGVVALQVLRRNHGAAARITLAFVPALLWYSFVWLRWGTFPPLDPYLRDNETVGPPVLALVKSLTQPATSGALLLCLIHVGIWILVIWLAATKRTAWAIIASVVGLQLLVSGPFAWTFLGDGTRTSVFLELTAILAILATIRPAWLPTKDLEHSSP